MNEPTCPCGSDAPWCCADCGARRCLPCLRDDLRSTALANVQPPLPPLADAAYELIAAVHLGPDGLGVDALCDVMLALQADADLRGWGRLVLAEHAPPGEWRFMRVIRQQPLA